jgi:predicted nucleotidyltransferase
VRTRLNHEERIILANQITKQIVQESSDKKIELVAIAGSTSRGEDKQYSDLELVVLSDKSIEQRFFSRDGTVVEILSTTKDELKDILANLSHYQWPVWAGLVSTARSIYGDSEILEKVRKQLHRIPHSV